MLLFSYASAQAWDTGHLRFLSNLSSFWTASGDKVQSTFCCEQWREGATFERRYLGIVVAGRLALMRHAHVHRWQDPKVTNNCIMYWLRKPCTETIDETASASILWR